MPTNYGAEFDLDQPRFRENAAPISDAEKLQKDDEDEDVEPEGVHLKKELGLLSGIGLVVGTMIGSGIFVSPKSVLARSGSVGVSLFVWGGCGVLAMLGALCYCELGTLIHMSGGEYAYMMEAFGRSTKHKFLGPLPAYLFCWTSVLILKTSALGIICLAFAEYAMNPIFGDCGASEIVVKLCCICAILLLTVVNCYSVKVAAGLQNAFMFVKLSALAVIIIGGIVNLAQGKTENLEGGFEGTTSSPSDIALAFYSGLWAYDGWNNLNVVTEELKKPNKNIPRALIIGIPLVTVVYVAANVSYFTVMTKEQLFASPAVAVTWGDSMLGVMAWIIPVSVAFSTFGAANGSTFGAGRLCFVAAREGHLISILSYISINYLTPSPALIFQAIIAIVMIIPGNIESLIDFFSFSSWVFYGVTMVSLIVMRWTRADAKRPIKVPIVIPFIVLIISIYLVVAPIAEDPQLGYLYATIIILAGILFYVPFVYYKYHLRCMDSVTTWCQLFFEIVPQAPGTRIT